MIAATAANLRVTEDFLTAINVAHDGELSFGYARRAVVRRCCDDRSAARRNAGADPQGTAYSRAGRASLDKRSPCCGNRRHSNAQSGVGRERSPLVLYRVQRLRAWAG